MRGNNFFLPQIDPNNCHVHGSKNRWLDCGCFGFSVLQIHLQRRKCWARGHEESKEGTGRLSWHLSKLPAARCHLHQLFQNIFAECILICPPNSRTSPPSTFISGNSPPPLARTPACNILDIYNFLTSLVSRGLISFSFWTMLLPSTPSCSLLQIVLTLPLSWVFPTARQGSTRRDMEFLWSAG